MSSADMNQRGGSTMASSMMRQPYGDATTSSKLPGSALHKVAQPNVSGALTGTDVIAGNVSRQKVLSQYIERVLGAVVVGLTRFGHHWLFAMNVIFGVVVSGAILTPILFLLCQSNIA